MKNNGDNPIYPQKRKEYIYSGCSEVTYYGLTKREYFAGLTMAQIAGDPECTDMKDAAKWSVKAADALLKELEKPQTNE